MDDYGDYGESFYQELDRLRRENKELSSKLEAYRKLMDEMNSWYAMIAYSDYEKHEKLWESLVKRAAALKAPKP